MESSSRLWESDFKDWLVILLTCLVVILSLATVTVLVSAF